MTEVYAAPCWTDTVSLNETDWAAGLSKYTLLVTKWIKKQPSITEKTQFDTISIVK